MTTLETRVISGKGLIRVPNSQAAKDAKVLTLYADVIRPPRSPYQNYEYNPPRSVYARLVFLRGGVVMRSAILEFERQFWEDYPNISAQELYAIICSYKGNLQGLINLGVALGATPTTVVNRIKEWRHIRLFYDEVKVVCYGGAAVKLTLESTSYDLCPDDQDKDPVPPPPPPPPPTKYPAGSPLDGTADEVSPPYDSPNDGGDTTPDSGDGGGGDPIPTGTPVWQIVTNMRTVLVVSPTEPTQYVSSRCIAQGSSYAMGQVGNETIKPYCGQFTNYCMMDGEVIASVTLTGDICNDVFP